MATTARRSRKADETFFNKMFKFFTNKWTRRGFSLLSAGYLWFLGWVAWLTFAYHFVFENAAAVFFLYTFINVMFAIAMIYTRREILTRLVTLVLHLCILVMLIYGFGNWFLILPPFLASAVVFFASGVSESIKVILGTVYLILFVLAFLAYVTLQNLTMQVPFKMDLQHRYYFDEPAEIDYRFDESRYDEPRPYRLVAYVDPETKVNRTMACYIERTDLDKHMWNLTCERVYGGEKVGALKFGNQFVLYWTAPNALCFDGRLVEIEDGKIITSDGDDGTRTVNYEPQLDINDIENNGSDDNEDDEDIDGDGEDDDYDDDE